MAVDRPVGPEARAPFSRSTTRPAFPSARWKAMLAPLQPPPITTTAAVSLIARMLPWGPEGVKRTTAPESPRGSAVVETVLESPGSLRRPAETAWANDGRRDAERPGRRRGRPVLVQGARLGGRPPPAGERADEQLTAPLSHGDLQAVAGPHQARRLGGMAIHGDLPAGARVVSETSALVEPRGPQPAVETDARARRGRRVARLSVHAPALRSAHRRAATSPVRRPGRSPWLRDGGGPPGAAGARASAGGIAPPRNPPWRGSRPGAGLDPRVASRRGRGPRPGSEPARGRPRALRDSGCGALGPRGGA